MRRDALRNRERLLVAAGQVFEQKGLEASVADVARVAGVGMGTLYRRFPSKEALIDALVSEVLEATIAMAEEAAACPDGTGLEHFLRASSAYQAEHLGCLPKLWNSDHHLIKKARELIARLLSDAQAHGRIRRDLKSTDISLVMWSMRGVLETTRSNAPEAWKRHLDLLVAGMRPRMPRGTPAAQPEPGRPDPLEGRAAAGGDGGRPVTAVQDIEAGEVSGRTTRAHWWILVVIAGAQLMVVLDSTIMIIALPSAQHALGFSNTDRQWVVTAYTLAFGGFLLLGGRISDMFGPKRTLMTGVLGFALASAVGGAAQTTLMLIGARGLQGLFGALSAPSVLSLLTSTFTNPRERGRAFGIYATIAIAGSAFGLILGGFLTEYADWRWCLYVNLPIAALVLFGAFTMLPNRQGTPGVRLDVLGVVLGCGGLVALVYGLGEAGTSGWGATDVKAALVAAAVLLGCFILWQSKGPNPLLPLRVLRNRNRAGSFLTIMLAVTGMFGTFLFLTYLLQTIDHYSPLMTGVAFLPLLALNGLAATQLASRLMPHVRTRLLVVPGLLLSAAGAALFTTLTPGDAYVTHVLPSELLLGIGLGLAIVPCISTATQNADPKDVGVTSAMTNTSQQIGASIGTALLNTIAAAATATYLTAPRGAGASGGQGDGPRVRHGQRLGGGDLRPRRRGRRGPHQRAPGTAGPGAERRGPGGGRPGARAGAGAGAGAGAPPTRGVLTRAGYAGADPLGSAPATPRSIGGQR